jgi:copper transport protein
MRLKRLLYAGVLALALLCVAAPALAHGYIVRAIPEDRAALARSPLRVQVWFSEALEPEFSQITVANAAGEVIASAPADPDDHSLLAVRLPPGLPDGAYSVDMRIAFASDGHVINERRVFFVGEAGDMASAAASDAAIPLEVLWRALALGGAMVLLGATALYALVLVPAWGSSAYPAGRLPPRVMTALNRLMLAALLTALAGNLLALLQQTMAFFDADAVRVLTEGLWQVVRTGTQFGDTWTFRMLLLGITGGLWFASLWARGQQPAFVRSFWAASAWASALLLGSYSLASHAAGSPVLPWFALANDWLHLTAVSIWAGGLATLVWVLPSALRPYDQEAQRQALLAALNRFSPLAFASALIVVTSGIFASLLWITGPQQALSRYGLSLAGKVLLVAALLGLGALHRAALDPARYARLAALGQRIGGLNRTLFIEAALGLVIVGAAALLSATPVPRQPIVSATAPSAVAEVGATQVSLTMAPGGPGVNTEDVLVQRAGQPADGVMVAVRVVDPVRDIRGAWRPADPAGDGLFVAAGADIDRPGPWLALVDVRDGPDLTRVAFPFEISADAAVQIVRPPSLLNVLALLAVFGAALIGLWPLIRRGYNRLDTSPLALALLGGALLLIVVVVAGGVILSQQSDAMFASYMTPLPSQVNLVLPDHESLARGAAALNQSCAAWADSPVFDELVERLPRLRDEELYDAVTNGWRALPACDAALDETARWDVVNYVRSLEPYGES